MPSIYKRKLFPGKVLFIDGISGTGKTMVNVILDCYKENLLPKFVYPIEHLCIGSNLGQIKDDLAKNLMKILLNQTRYDLSIGREVNLRPSDLSSLYRSPNKFKHLKNFLKTDGATAENRIKKNPKNLVIITHQLMDSLTKILPPQKNVYYVQMMRNPFYLIEHWINVLKFYGKSERDFTIWSQYGIKSIPWFISKSEFVTKFSKYNDLEKVFSCLIVLNRRSLKLHKEFSGQRNYVPIFFEKFVLNPQDIIVRFDQICGIHEKLKLKMAYKREKLPRTKINSGKNRKIYRRYGVLNIEKYEKTDVEMQLFEKYNGKVSPILLEKFLDEIYLYETQFNLSP